MSLTPGTVLAGRYRIEEKLDEGGMGAVHLARRVSDGSLVVIKTLLPSWAEKPAAKARFGREAEAAMSVTHPGVVRVLEYEADAQAPFIVMEHIDGRTLTEVIKEPPLMPLARATALTHQILSAVSAAHALGIVHRDLKPSNIMVVDEGRASESVRVLDFGLSRIFDDERRAKLTETGQVLGTPGFLAPEQATGGELGPGTDLWAVGVMLYVMLAERLPWEAPSAGERIAAMLRDEPTRIETRRPDVPVRVAAVIHRAIAIEAAARFASAEEMSRALAAAVNGLEIPITAAGDVVEVPDTRPASELAAASRPRGRLALAGAFASGVLVASVVGVLLTSLSRSDEPIAPSAETTAPTTTGIAVSAMRFRRFGDAHELDAIEREEANRWVDEGLRHFDASITSVPDDAVLDVQVNFDGHGVATALGVRGPGSVSEKECVRQRVTLSHRGPADGRIQFRLKLR